MIRILLAGGQTLCRAALRALLEASSGLQVAGEAATESEARAACQRLKPEMLFLDLDGPEACVIDAIRQVRQDSASVRIIVLCAKPDRQTLFECLRAGANGIVTKDVKPSDLVVAIRSVAKTGAYVSPSISGLIMDDYLRRAQGKHHASEVELLSEREREVLKGIADGLSNAEIAESLGVQSRTAESHRQSIIRKLDIRTVAGLTRFAIRHGLSSLDE